MESPRKARTYQKIAESKAESGNFKEALESYSKSLEVQEKAFGKESPSLGTTYYNIGSLHFKQEKYDQALENFTKAKDIRIKTLGETHISVSEIYSSIGDIFFAQGKYQQAIDEYQKGCTGCEANNSPESKKLLITFYEKIAKCSFKLDQKEQGEKYLAKAIELAALMHEAPGHTSEGAANRYSKQTSFSQALARQNSLQKSIYHKNDNENLYLEIANEKEGKGAIQEAISYYQRYLQVLKENPKVENSILVKTNEKIAELYEGLQDYEEAANYYHIALEIKLEDSHSKSEDLAKLYTKIGRLMEHLNDLEAGIYSYNSSLELIRPLKTDKSWLLSQNYQGLARIQEKKGEYEEAFKLYKKALSSQTVIDQEEIKVISLELAALYVKVGDLDRENGNHDQARKRYNEALELYNKIGNDHKSLKGMVYDKLGDLDLQLGMYQAAHIHYEKGLEQKLKIYEKHDKEIAISYKKIGLAQFRHEEYKNSMEHFLHSLHILNKNLVENRDIIAEISYYLGIIYEHFDDYDQSFRYLWLSLGSSRRRSSETKFKDGVPMNKDQLINFYRRYSLRHGESDPGNRVILLKIAETYEHHGEIKEMIEAYNKVITLRKQHEQNEKFNIEIYHKIAKGYSVIGQEKDSLSIYNTLKSLISKEDEEYYPILIEANLSIGRVLCNQGHYKDAVGNYLQALEIAGKTNNAQKYIIEITYEIGVLHFKEKSLDQAIEYFNRALTLGRLEFGEQYIINALASQRLGEIFYQMNSFETSVQYLEMGIDLYIKLENHDDNNITRCFELLAEVLEKINNKAHLRRHYERSVELWHKLKRKSFPFAVDWLIKIGEMYYSEKKYMEAITRLATAARLIQETQINDPLKKAKIHTLLGNSEFYGGMLRPALSNYKLAIKIYCENNIAADRVLYESYKMITKIYYLLKKFPESLSAFREIECIISQLSGLDTLELAGLRIMKAECYMAAQRYLECYEEITGVIPSLKKLGKEGYPELGKCYFMMSKLYWRNRQYGKGIKYLWIAIKYQYHQGFYWSKALIKCILLSYILWFIYKKIDNRLQKIILNLFESILL